MLTAINKAMISWNESLILWDILLLPGNEPIIPRNEANIPFFFLPIPFLFPNPNKDAQDLRDKQDKKPQLLYFVLSCASWLSLFSLIS